MKVADTNTAFSINFEKSSTEESITAVIKQSLLLFECCVLLALYGNISFTVMLVKYWYFTVILIHYYWYLNIT